jgi:8-oxo-dGTP pyrophosphatase MutT (NUDIX family)
MAHIHEKIDWTVEVFIVYKDKVLIRKHDKYGGWFGVGGHIELDEDPIPAAKRECLEEVGLDVRIYKEDEYVEMEPRRKNIPVPAFMDIHPINETHSHIVLVYFGTSDTDEVIPENTTDVWVWLTKEEVEKHPEISPKNKEYAIAALEACAS